MEEANQDEIVAGYVRETAKALRARTQCWCLLKFIEQAWPELYPDVPYERSGVVEFLSMLIERYGSDASSARRVRFQLSPNGTITIIDTRDSH